VYSHLTRPKAAMKRVSSGSGPPGSLRCTSSQGMNGRWIEHQVLQPALLLPQGLLKRLREELGEQARAELPQLFVECLRRFGFEVSLQSIAMALATVSWPLSFAQSERQVMGKRDLDGHRSPTPSHARPSARTRASSMLTGLRRSWPGDRRKRSDGGGTGPHRAAFTPQS
jgi:hypothetical protein